MLRASLGTVNINHCQRLSTRSKTMLGNGLRGKSLRLVGRCPTNLAPDHRLISVTSQFLYFLSFMACFMRFSSNTHGRPQAVGKVHFARENGAIPFS